MSPDATACTDDNNACTQDQCKQGQCVHPALADGTACGASGSGSICRSAVCQPPKLRCQWDGSNYGVYQWSTTTKTFSLVASGPYCNCSDSMTLNYDGWRPNDTCALCESTAQYVFGCW
jgi:hypothetical protein